MTFRPIFGNLRKKSALDCDTITYLNERKSQFLDRLMDSRLFLALKRCGFESSSTSVFFLFFPFFLNLFVHFSEILPETLSECQAVCIQISSYVLSVLISVQTVCKGYQQTSKVAADKERVRKNRT